MADRMRSDAKMLHIPAEIRSQVDQYLLDGGISLREISEWLKGEGYDISKNAVSNYARYVGKSAQRIKESLIKMKLLVDAATENPDTDYTMATRIMAMDGLLKRVACAEDEFLELPLDKAVALIGTLTNADTQARRAKHSNKSRMELALEKMEQDIADVIKANPELSKEFRNVMEKARREFLSEE